MIDSNITENNSCMATYLPSHKPSKEDEQNMQSTAGEAEMNSWAMFSDRLLRIEAPVLAD